MFGIKRNDLVKQTNCLCNVNRMIIQFSKSSISPNIFCSIHTFLQIIIRLNGQCGMELKNSVPQPAAPAATTFVFPSVSFLFYSMLMRNLYLVEVHWAELLVLVPEDLPQLGPISHRQPGGKHVTCLRSLYSE